MLPGLAGTESDISKESPCEQTVKGHKEKSKQLPFLRSLLFSARRFVVQGFLLVGSMGFSEITTGKPLPCPVRYLFLLARWLSLSYLFSLSLAFVNALLHGGLALCGALVIRSFVCVVNAT